MLVITRKRGQEVRLPGLDIVIRVMEGKGSRIQLGFTAPPNIQIVRSELVAQASSTDMAKQCLSDTRELQGSAANDIAHDVLTPLA